MNAMLEKKLDTPFLPEYVEYIEYKPLQPSNSKGLRGDGFVLNGQNEVASTEYKPAKTSEIFIETLVFPIPDDAPLPPKRFNSITVDGKKAARSASWSYRDAHNKLLCHILRFDIEDGKKEFRPLTLWNTSKGLAWKNKGMPEPRPLYGLDRLAQMPDAEVIVCEGEKAADAAALLFPAMAVVSSMNGAKSPNKTDWSPLAGRTVGLWADNDQPGQDYIAEVERLATEAGATVKHAVRLDWFRQMSREVGAARNELPSGWDAADALADGLSRNDSILILDDLGQADAKECGQAAYLIANGQGKARMQKEGGNRPLTTWKTFLLSSGEIDLSQHMSEAGKTARGGQVARLPSIPADAGSGHYVLENLHGVPDGRQFADTMKSVSRQFYGTAGAAFMEALADPVMLKETRETIREGITEIVRLLRVPKEAAPEVGRVAARFALVAFAGELATRLGVTGWQSGDAFKAAVRCFNDWLAESGGASL
jgi:Domain of unknown function (DUF927)